MATPAATHRTGVSETYRVDETDLDADLLGQLQTTGYRWTSARRTPDGRWHHLVSTSDNRGFRARRERLVSLVMPVLAGGVEPVPALPTIAGVVMMSANEARSCVSRIRGHLENARRELLDLHDREGWKALGYESWRACAVAEFGKSSAQVYRLLSAAQIERELDSPIGETPESHLRPLTELDTAEERREAWEQANAHTGSDQRTARDVQQAVDKLKQRAGVETTAQIREVKRRVRAVEGTYYGYDPQQGYRVGLRGKGAQYYQPDELRRELERRDVAGQTAEARAARDTAAQQEQQAHALPPLPADLSAWTRWRNADGTIGMRHPCGLKLDGKDAGALEAEARALVRPLSELAEHGWRVFDDGGSYRAMHQGYDIITAPDLPRLALAAWRCRVGETSLPDLPDVVVDGLFLAGHDPVEVAQRGLPLGELRYLAGVVEPAPATYAPVERATAAEPIPIAVYAPSVTHLTAIRTALMTNDRAGAIRTALELLGVLAGADLRAALQEAIVALDAEGRAGVADRLRPFVASSKVVLSGGSYDG